MKDIAWLLGCAALVFLMQAGFLCLESGLTRSKNSINVAVKNLSDFGVAILLFWMLGFALMFGHSTGGWVGTTDWFVNVERDPYGAAFFVFQAMFCGTATTVVSGAAAERLQYGGYLLISVLNAAMIYPLFGHWVWNGAEQREKFGWLAQLGFVDFAGSTVVHLVGASVAFAVLLVVGPRMGRFQGKGRSRKIHGSDLPLSMLGTMLLWLGWLGFNGGSSLSLDITVARIVVHTLIAGTSGMVAASVFNWLKRGVPDVEPLINGGLAGLVGVTASCNAVTTPQSAFIGAIAAIVMLWAEGLLERWQIDDAVGAIPVHGAAGIWGTLAVAIFGDLRTLDTGLSRLEQVAVQGFGILVAIAWAFGVSFLLLSLYNRFSPLRVSSQAETMGLNVAEHDARTELHDLFEVMDDHIRGTDLSVRAPVEPFTEVGYIATRYNQVMDALQKKTAELEGFNANLEELVRDRTLDLQAVNRELQDLDRLKDEFLANTSHELRTPLNGIIGLSESLADGAIGVINAEQYKSLTLIIQSGHRLINLINDILDFSKLKNRKLMLQCGPVDLASIVEDVIGLYQAQAQMQHLTLTAEMAPDLPRLWGDGDRIQQILHNLVGNALKFTEQGSITLRAQLADGPESSEMQLSIADTGVGISKENLDSIFGAFEQGDGTTARRYSGTGLGLAITRQLVELHHGQLWVESVVGEGSTFFVTFPIAELVPGRMGMWQSGDRSAPPSPAPATTSPPTASPTPPPATSVPPPPAPTPDDTPLPVFPTAGEDIAPLPASSLSSQTLIQDGNDGDLAPSIAPVESSESPPAFPSPEPTLVDLDEGLLAQSNLFVREGVPIHDIPPLFRILIVDDEPINQKVLLDYLGNGFYEVRAVSSGQAALQMVLEERWLPNIILMDVMMPLMSGYETTLKLREVFSSGDLPVIMLTAKNQVSDRVQGLEVGANDYLTKPISKMELMARLKTHLELSNITLAYARFVPHEFLDLLKKNSILEVELGDQVEQEMAVLFADIRDFTTLSEGMTPSENFQFINAYLSRMEPVIHKHGGFIDKFIGDAIMALFPGGSQMAIAAAVEMLHTLEEYNGARVEKGWQPMRIGIGINEGRLRLGTVGGQERMSGTAIGDAVNLAARLEGLTKTYKTPLLISQYALAKMSDPSLFQLRFIDRQQVKGKSVPVGIFEILDGLDPEVRDRRQAGKTEFESALWLYYGERYPEAVQKLAQYLQTHPQDFVAQLYLQRSMQGERGKSALR